jgi:hypothetical protein
MRNSDAGFSLVDVIGALTVTTTVMVIAVPPMLNMVDQYRLGNSTRLVERELQFAKLKAVSSDSPMRLRLNCPVAGQLRAVELVGTPSVPDPLQDPDSYTDRCNDTIYPYRPTGADQSRLTKPNNDGPTRFVDSSVTMSAVSGTTNVQTVEFWADGSVHANLNNTNPWTNIGGAGVTITLTRKGVTKTITVNGLGKILAQR